MSSDRRRQRIEGVSEALRHCGLPHDVASELAKVADDNATGVIARGLAAGTSSEEVEADAIAALTNVLQVLSTAGVQADDVLRIYHDEVLVCAGFGEEPTLAAAAAIEPGVVPHEPAAVRTVERLTADALLDWGRPQPDDESVPEATPSRRTGATALHGVLAWGLVAALTIGGLAYGVVLLAGGPRDGDEKFVALAERDTAAAAAANEVTSTGSPPAVAEEVTTAVTAGALAAPRPSLPATAAREAAAAEATAMVAPEPPRPIAAPQPVHLGGIPWEAELETLVQAVTARSGWGSLWGTDGDEAERRLGGGLANRREQLDEMPGVSRIEVHRQAKREYSRPHLGLEFLNDRLYLIYLYYERHAGVSAAKLAATLTKAHGASVATWDEGSRRKCEGWDVNPSVRVALCRLMSPSGKKVQELLVNVYDPATFARALGDRVRAADAQSALDGGRYRTSFRSYDDAIARFDEVLSGVPTFELARAWRAITLLCARRVPEARSEIAGVLSRAKSYGTLAFADWVMARIQVYEGRTDAAIANLEAAVAADPWNGDFETYATELRTGELSGLLCAKVAAWVEDERREGNRDRGEVCRRAGIPDPAWLDRCSAEAAAGDPDWASKVTALVDKWRERRSGR